MSRLISVRPGALIFYREGVSVIGLDGDCRAALFDQAAEARDAEIFERLFP